MSPEAPDRPTADRSPTPVCGAPFFSLHLDPSGNVRVCCFNSLGMLGNIRDSSLRELWTGTRMTRLRSAIAARDLSMGCESCHPDALGPRRSITQAAYYDRFGPITDTSPKWPIQLELALSNRCNLECVMCNGDLSSKIRAHREGLAPLPTVYTDTFFDELAEFAPHLRRVTFIGGEPFLAPEALRAFEILMETNPTVEVQVTTNGTVATPRVERILDALPVEVSISMDGATAHTYESIRIGSDFAATLRNVEWFRTRAKSLSLNYCLMPNNWHEVVAFARLADDFGVPFHINSVTSPPSFSLTHLPPSDLAPIVDAIVAERYDGRNRSVIDQQVERLRAHLETGGSTDVLVSIGATAHAGSSTNDPPLPLNNARLAELLRSHVHDTERSTITGRPDGGPSDLIEIGVLAIASERIVSAVAETPGSASAPIAGMDLHSQVGRHLTELVGLMTGTHGELLNSSMVVHPNGEEERRLTFVSAGETTTICALLVQAHEPSYGDPTSFWVLGRLAAAAGPAADPIAMRSVAVR